MKEPLQSCHVSSLLSVDCPPGHRFDRRNLISCTHIRAVARIQVGKTGLFSQGGEVQKSGRKNHGNLIISSLKLPIIWTFWLKGGWPPVSLTTALHLCAVVCTWDISIDLFKDRYTELLNSCLPAWNSCESEFVCFGIYVTHWRI